MSSFCSHFFSKQFQHICISLDVNFNESLTNHVFEQLGPGLQDRYDCLFQGAAAQGANPVYAKDIDVIVPNVSIDTGHIIRTDDVVIKTKFKSEVSFETAYSGVSTRKVIMEERNVYCGPYNVMVLCDQ